MADFLDKASDNELVDIAAQFLATLSARVAAYGATDADALNLQAKLNTYENDLTMHIAALTNIRAKRERKETSRRELEQSIRHLIRQAMLKRASSADLAAAVGIPTRAYPVVSSGRKSYQTVIQTNASFCS